MIGGQVADLEIPSGKKTLAEHDFISRCKTGALTGVVSVCGYLQTMDGKLRVFAIILNGNAKHEDVWAMVSTWAN